MAQQTINTGTAPNDGTGDPLQTAFNKCNDNFTELYNADVAGYSNISNGTSNVRIASSGSNVTVGVGGTGNVAVFATTGEYVTGLMSVTGNITGGNLITAALAQAATLSATGAVTFSGTTTNQSIGGSLTTGTLTMGGASGTGIITVGQSTASQTTNIQSGTTGTGNTKTINLGVGGLAGSTTTIAIGPVADTTAAATATFNTATRVAIANTGGTALSVAGNITGAVVSVGVASPTAALEIKAGTATVAPLKLTAGTNLTTPVAGVVEFDGNAFYSTDDVTGGRGYIPSVHYFRLTADGTAAGPTIANYFGATSGTSLDNNVFYELEANLFFTKTTAGTVTFTMTFTQAPINNDAWYVGTPVGGVGTVGTPQTAAIVKSTATAGALPPTGTLTTAVNHQYQLRAMFQANVTTGGTLNIQVTSGSGTVTPLTGSYYKITRLPSANAGTFA